MELTRQWCDHKTCSDFGTIEAGNIRVFSYVEQRYYCTTCRHTFSKDKHTFFETVRRPRLMVIEALALLGERNSLRAVARLTHHSPNRILHWLDLAGRHAAAVSAALIRNLHLTQAQIDELWTFVKKNKRIANPMIPRMSAICGYGVPWRCPAACAS
jgi:transposase-like protein